MSIIGNPITIGGGSADLGTLSVTANGTYTASDESLDGYSEVTVAVEDGSTLGTKSVTANGTYTATDDSLDGYSSVTVAVPLGTKEITTNGTYTATDDSVDGYSEVTVAVEANVGEKSITANGTYTATDDSLDGYSSVTVAVESESSTLVEKTITANGTYDPADDSADGYSSVTVNVSGGSEEWTTLTDYIESSGTQYINTGYSVTSDTRIEVVANVPDNSNEYPAIYGARTNTNDEVVIFAEFQDSNIAMVWATGDTSFSPSFWSRGYIGSKCNYIMGGDGSIGIRDTDGNGFMGSRTAGTGSTQPIYIFNLNENGSALSICYCTMKLYRMRIYESDVLVHEFIPWTDDDSVVCLKDTVDDTLYYNAGSGDFTYGTDS